MTVGHHTGADMQLLAEVLPRIEPTIILNMAGDDAGTGPEGGDNGTT